MIALPDLLRPGLDVVFVGTAAGRRAAEAGAYYAHPGNRFWRTLHEVGITPRLYEPSEFRELLDLGIGFTDVSKTGAGMDHEIEPHHFDVALLETNIRRHKPRAIAFTSKKAASLLLGKPTGGIPLGHQQHHRPDFPDVFVLSSPSGMARGHWDAMPWRELAQWLKALQPS